MFELIGTVPIDLEMWVLSVYPHEEFTFYIPTCEACHKWHHPDKNGFCPKVDLNGSLKEDG